MTLAFEGLELDPDRMAANLGLTRGLPMAEAVSIALAAKVGRQAAHRLVEAASRRALADGSDLGRALKAEPEVTAHLSPGDIDALMQPLAYLGAAPALVRRALAPKTP
jgi:3-carboxy-cis,cis-muconate cycloisomerase